MFLCLLNLDGNSVTDVERSRYVARMRQLASATAVATEHVELIDAGEFVAMVAPAMVPLRPLWGRRGKLLGIGNVRLDHRNGVQRLCDDRVDTALSDLELVLAAIDRRGTRCIREMLGDFAFVTWESQTRTLTAARDAFGVRTLFIGTRGRLLVLSSHLELVHESETFDEEYVADFLVTGDPGPIRTIWADSQAISQGSIATVCAGRRTDERFWDPFDFSPAASCNEQDQIEQFRALFLEAVRTRLDPGGKTWAELSGGLDSSSIVSAAQTLSEAGSIPNGVASTVTIVDELGAGDERRFSDAVLQRFGLSNTAVLNPWPWQDDGRTPPKTDEPRTHYPYFARDRQIGDVVRSAGGRVLLSGFGSDHYLYGNRLYIADLVASGHFARALREVTRWAVQEQRSFWRELMRSGVAPFFPSLTPQRIESIHTVPDWIEPSFAKRLAIHDRLPAFRGQRAPRQRKFAEYISKSMQEVVRWLPRATFEEGLELRYPFFYRPLVELGLRLPPTMRVQPRAPKWILRQAMQGILPDTVRLRTGKGAIDARLNWGFAHERQHILTILSHSTLAAQGIVRRDRAEAALDQAIRGEKQSIVTLLAALSLDTWFFVRSNRWVAGEDKTLSCSATPTRMTQSA